MLFLVSNFKDEDLLIIKMMAIMMMMMMQFYMEKFFYSVIYSLKILENHFYQDTIYSYIISNLYLLCLCL